MMTAEASMFHKPAARQKNRLMLDGLNQRGVCLVSKKGAGYHVVWSFLPPSSSCFIFCYVALLLLGMYIRDCIGRKWSNGPLQ